MCGIVGIYQRDQNNSKLMESMLESIAHRGPDASTVYDHGSFCLGHRRLSIIDLDTGDQPLFNKTKTKCIVYNGEVYNYKELKQKLEAEGCEFQTNSDTEVVLKAYEYYGPNSFDMLNGIFAFAIYDLEKQEIVLVRDHFGIKPLHYYFKDGLFVFSSEQKAIIKHPAISPRLNRRALHLHLNLRYTQGNETLFEGIKRLPAAHWLRFSASEGMSIDKYWHHNFEIADDLKEDEVKLKFNALLKQAVKRQLVSDVPIGVYLSGGLDSSAIVQKMSELGVQEINTFTLGFNEPTDEFSDARLVANEFNTNHREVSLSMNPLSSMSKVIWYAEEPKINLLQGYHLSKFVSKHVKVVLGGLGGDELMAGYDIHRLIYPSRKLHKLVPKGLQSMFNWKSSFLHRVQTASGTLRFDEYRRGMQMLLSIGQIEKYYLILRNVWDFDNRQYDKIYDKDYAAYAKSQIPKTLTEFESLFEQVKTHRPLDKVLFAEFHSKMENDYLLVEDRMSMANSVEERVPFLDKDLVEFGFQIPLKMKMKQGQTKSLFREAMKGKLPSRILEKKKWGFSVNPYEQYKKDLKTKVEEQLSESYIKEQGIFNYQYIKSILNYPAHKKLRWHYNFLWLLLGLKEWERVFNVDFKK